jgi:hypothetical protein
VTQRGIRSVASKASTDAACVPPRDHLAGAALAPPSWRRAGTYRSCRTGDRGVRITPLCQVEIFLPARRSSLPRGTAPAPICRTGDRGCPDHLLRSRGRHLVRAEPGPASWRRARRLFCVPWSRTWAPRHRLVIRRPAWSSASAAICHVRDCGVSGSLCCLHVEHPRVIPCSPACSCRAAGDCHARGRGVSDHRV